MNDLDIYRCAGVLVNPAPIGGGRTGNRISMNQLVPELTKHGIDLFPVISSSTTLFSRGLLRLLRGAHWKMVRFIILNSSAVLRKKESLFILKIAKQFNIPVFVYYRESNYQLEKLQESSPEQAARIRLFLKDLYLHIWVNSEFTLHDNAANIRGNVTVVHNGVSVDEELLFQSSEYLKLFPPTVIQLATIQELKDWKIFIETAKLVIKEIPLAQFIWLGDGAERIRALEKVKSAGLSTNVFFPGFMSNPDMMFRNAHIFFQTSISESFSLTTAQAMAFGKEIVMFKGVGGAEEVAGGLADVINSRDPKLAAKKIIEIFQRAPKLRLDMMERYQALYTIERHAKRIAVAIQDAVNIR